MNDNSNINSPDLPFQNQQSPLILLQALSPQVIPGDPRHIAGAMAGMFAGRLDDEQVLFSEFVFQLVGFLSPTPSSRPTRRRRSRITAKGCRTEAQFHYATRAMRGVVIGCPMATKSCRPSMPSS